MMPEGYRGETGTSLPNLAHRAISVRCGIWSLPGHSGHLVKPAPIKLDLVWLLGAVVVMLGIIADRIH
jgi:hypothetical protein